jgi:hypothetical protein
MSDFDPDKIFAALVKAGEDWADMDAAANLLEETRKSVLANLKLKSSGTSDAARETQALADPSYSAFIRGMVDARKAANKARVRYDSGKTLSELRRSEESTKRAEMSLR